MPAPAKAQSALPEHWSRCSCRDCDVHVDPIEGTRQRVLVDERIELGGGCWRRRPGRGIDLDVDALPMGNESSRLFEHDVRRLLRISPIEPVVTQIDIHASAPPNVTASHRPNGLEGIDPSVTMRWHRARGGGKPVCSE